MKNNIILIIFFVFVIIIPCFCFAESNEEFVLIKYKNSKNIEDVAKRYLLGIDNVEKISNFNVYKINNHDWKTKIKIKIDKVFSREIEYIVPDNEFHSLLVPNDAYYSNQWALPKISAPEGWDITQGNNEVKIAIIDTGIDGTHEDLSGKVLAGYDFVNDISIPAGSDSDDSFHGTAVSGAAAALSNNRKGVTGVDWNAELIPVKALDSEGSGYASDIALAIRYAADSGAKVLNLSFGGESSNPILDEAINYAYDKGCFIVAAAGNDGGSVDEPARNPKVFAVGATTNLDERWSKSSYGPELDAVAPGDSVLTTIDEIPGADYAYVTGTSIAAPQVSGLAALILSRSSEFTNAEIESFIKNNSDKVARMGGNDFTNYYGYGRISVYKTVNNYHYIWVSQNEYPSLMPGESHEFIVKLKNTGTASWNPGVVRLGTSNPLDRKPGFLRETGWISDNRVELTTSPVNPKEETEIHFNYKVPDDFKPGLYNEYFRPVADGISWMEDYGIFWKINVLSGYQSQWQSQSPYPVLGRGQTGLFEVKISNNGYIPWTKNIIHLGTSNPLDRIPIFNRSAGWFSNNRVSMMEDIVNYGETATFQFEYKVPANAAPKIYREYFRPVADGFAWMNDQGISWDITVPPDDKAYKSIWIGQNPCPVPALHRGESVELILTMKNNGLANWTKDIVRLGTSNPLDRTPVFDRGTGWFSNNRVEMFESTVSPGANATFKFNYTIPDDLSAGSYREYFRPVVDGVTWLEDYSIYWDFVVEE